MGKTVDLGALMLENEQVRAVGNMKVNARGDELGPGGQIIRKREEVLKEYYQQAAEPVKAAPARESTPVDNPADTEETLVEKLKSGKV